MRTLRLHFPSPLDVEDMEQGYLYLVVSVNEVVSCEEWKINRKRRTLSGTLGKLRMEIAAYCLDQDSKVHQIPVKVRGLKRK
ncbi:MAG: hypothetical protein V2G48_07620 [bacterium JZ-2024 1]